MEKPCSKCRHKYRIQLSFNCIQCSISPFMGYDEERTTKGGIYAESNCNS